MRCRPAWWGRLMPWKLQPAPLPGVRWACFVAAVGGRWVAPVPEGHWNLRTVWVWIRPRGASFRRLPWLTPWLVPWAAGCPPAWAGRDVAGAWDGCERWQKRGRFSCIAGAIRIDPLLIANGGVLTQSFAGNFFGKEWGLPASNGAMTPTRTRSSDDMARPKPGRAIHDDDDGALISRVASGDPVAFEWLVERHAETVARLSERLLAWSGPSAAMPDVEDLVQDVFARVWERAGDFRHQSSVKTWITAVTLNLCRNRRRREWVRRMVLRRFAGRRDESTPAADESAVRDEDSERVRAAVRSLRPIDREVIVLHYLEGLPAARIAEVLSVSLSAAELRLYRARGRLRSLLGNHVDGSDER